MKGIRLNSLAWLWASFRRLCKVRGMMESGQVRLIRQRDGAEVGKVSEEEWKAIPLSLDDSLQAQSPHPGRVHLTKMCQGCWQRFFQARVPISTITQQTEGYKVSLCHWKLTIASGEPKAALGQIFHQSVSYA